MEYAIVGDRFVNERQAEAEFFEIVIFESRRKSVVSFPRFLISGRHGGESFQFPGRMWIFNGRM